MAEKTKQKKVVALQYDAKNQGAPKIVGKGRGTMADRILQLAFEHDIPLKEDPELVEILGHLEIGKEIPPELFQAVAEVLIFIYKMNQKKMKRFEEDNAEAENSRRESAVE